MKIGTKVKIKTLKELHSLTGIGFQRAVKMKNGGMFGPVMLCYAEQVGEITEIKYPGKDNQLTAPAYKIGDVDIYWSSELFEVIS